MQSEQRQSQNEDELQNNLLRGLNSYKRGVRATHMRQVNALPPERLLLMMQEGARMYRKRYRLSTCVELLLLIAWLPIGLLLFLSGGLGVNLFGWSLLIVACLAILWHVCTVPWRMYRALVDVLEHTEDMRLVGPAISMYVRPDAPGRTRAILGKTLCRLLPRLRSNQATLLTTDQMQDMFRLISLSAPVYSQPIQDLNINITLSALKALEQVGTESVIPTVQNLASPILNPNSIVQKAAERCLEHLRLNMGQHRERQTLLRASSSNDSVAPDTLLRPAANGGDTASEQLLRPQL